MNYKWILPELDKELLHTHDLYNELSQLLLANLPSVVGMPVVIYIEGEAGSGRKFLISKIAHNLGCPLFFSDLSDRRVDYDELVQSTEMHGAIVCVENPQDSTQVGSIAKQLGLLFVIGEPPSENGEFFVLKRKIPDLRNSDRELVLVTLLEGINFADDIHPLTEIGLSHLNIGALQTFANKLKIESIVLDNNINQEIFRRILREVTVMQISGTVLMESNIYLKDVILPETQKQQLSEISVFVQCRKRVYEDWGFAKKLPWGRGISVLFYGAPGTGKTMAAAALANESGLPLLRVDISQVISKYIGDTQKNIGSIFDGATKTDSVLFFDEADALFAKRGDSGDTQDKYANAETAYLLQRMEQYDGVCILATNLLQNFDEAFRRRMGYMIHFSMPDATQREGIWRGIFPKEAPLGNIDFGFLARQLEFSGATIKNSALHATYLAAMNDSEITTKYILLGAKNEYTKMGKSLSPQLAQFLADEK